MAAHRIPIEERFWTKVERRGQDECWPWLGARTNRGYGAVKVDGKQMYAHRVVLMLDGRPIADDRMACHTCDNPPCVNPAHVYIGDVFTNNRDTLARARSPFTGSRRRRTSDSLKDAYSSGRHAKPRMHATCHKGHPLVEGNLYFFRSKDPTRPIKRRCRTCTLDYIHARKAAS